MDKQLAKAIAGAEAADRLTRIEWRDPIAQYGVAAIDAVAPWISDPELGAFAVRVIEAAAGHGAKAEAVEALSSVGRLGPSAAVLRDVDDALGRLAPKSTAASGGTARVRLHTRDGWDWPGFQDADFGQTVGTSWRRRADPISMVPLVLRPLLEIDPDFSSWPIYGLPEVHLAVRDRYRQGGEAAQGWRASKLVVYANGPTLEWPTGPRHVAAGWFLERGDGSPKCGPVDRELWDWPRFLELLADPKRRAALEAVVARHDLSVGHYLGGSFRPGVVPGYRARLEGGELVLRGIDDGAQVGVGWDALLELLRGLDPAEWHALHIWREWPAEEAVAMGQPFAVHEVAPVLVDLARVYLDTIWPGGRKD
jgi:hypothetical protein